MKENHIHPAIAKLITLSALFALAAILFSAFHAKGQNAATSNNAVTAMPSFSGGLQQIYDATTGSTNYGLVIGGGRSTTGQRNLAFADLAYNFTPSVGMIIGYDYLWASRHFGLPAQANLVKGGVNLQADLKPFKNSFTVTPFAFALVSSGNGTVSEIIGGGAKTTLFEFKGIKFDLGVLYQNRTGAGFWDGRYFGGFAALTKGFL